MPNAQEEIFKSIISSALNLFDVRNWYDFSRNGLRFSTNVVRCVIETYNESGESVSNEVHVCTPECLSNCPLHHSYRVTENITLQPPSQQLPSVIESVLPSVPEFVLPSVPESVLPSVPESVPSSDSDVEELDVVSIALEPSPFTVTQNVSVSTNVSMEQNVPSIQSSSSSTESEDEIPESGVTYATAITGKKRTSTPVNTPKTVKRQRYSTPKASTSRRTTRAPTQKRTRSMATKIPKRKK